MPIPDGAPRAIRRFWSVQYAFRPRSSVRVPGWTDQQSGSQTVHCLERSLFSFCFHFFVRQYSSEAGYGSVAAEAGYGSAAEIIVSRLPLLLHTGSLLAASLLIHVTWQTLRNLPEFSDCRNRTALSFTIISNIVDNISPTWQLAVTTRRLAALRGAAPRINYKV